MAAAADQTRLLLERVSRAIEDHPDSDDRTIRHRAGVPRRSGDQALELLVRAGLVARNRVNATWLYRSVKPYRAAAYAPPPDYGSTHSAGQGGDG
jgi:hypothetical protein